MEGHVEAEPLMWDFADYAIPLDRPTDEIRAAAASFSMNTAQADGIPGGSGISTTWF